MKILLFILLLAAMTDGFAQMQATQTGADNIVGVDQFGRTVPAVGAFKSKKQVGIFYWPWIGHPYATGIYDATKISAMPNGLNLLYHFDHLDTAISPNGQAHFWGEPLFGYYNSGDEWVIRRQIKMLTTAGVDFIVFDLTNRVTYRSVYEKVLRIIEEFQKDGWNAPRAVFYTHSKSMETTQVLYNDLYSKNLYPDAWYRVGGKPMIIAYTDTADDRAEAVTRSDFAYQPKPYSKEMENFFYFKKPQWPFDPVFEDGFPWIEWTFPQPLHGGTMSVSVASHPKVPMSRSVTSGWINWGRGWDPEKSENIAEDVDRGTFFQRQWDHAIAADPDTVFIGGWNEWIAYKQPYGDEYMLCDAANKEYSRDIEPMKGGFEDAFYLQMITNIRRYKGLPPKTQQNTKHSINIKASPEQWAGRDSYKNIESKAHARSSYGASKVVFYEQDAPLNNLQEIKLAHDNKYVYFYVRAEKNFQPQEDPLKALQIFIGTGQPALKGWHGYEFLAEKGADSKSFILSSIDSSQNKKLLGSLDFHLKENIVQIAVPRKLIQGTSLQSIYFKVTDGLDNSSDLMDTYLTGSALPMGRLSFIYYLKAR